MKIALVHDDLIQRGGAEKLFMEMHEVFPEAPVYTSVASDYWIKFCKDKRIELHTSFLQNFPFSIKLNRYYSPFLFHNLAFESFDFSDFDLVISSSARYAHNIITKPQTKHISYINSPGRMFWESDEYFQNEDYGWFKPLKKLARIFLSPMLLHLRVSDYIAAQRADYVIANSKVPQDRIKKYYKRDATIIYPFVDFDYFAERKSSNKEKLHIVSNNTNSTFSKNYFVLVTRLVSWKKVEIAIKACKDLNLKLKIIGDGPDISRLKNFAQDSQVEFLGYVSDEEKAYILQNCIALINTQAEDFGIVPLEAMASGKPVIAYGKGGVLETVMPGTTGEFFSAQTPESLKEILQTFNPKKYNPEACRTQAKKFDRIVFATQLKDYVLRCS
jgi:glycosyltransferase involved in cell wall biosynthesis